MKSQLHLNIMAIPQPLYMPCAPLLYRFGNNRGVTVQVESGGRSGTKYHLFDASYGNLTDYLVRTMGYTIGKDLFGAPYDWRMHISGVCEWNAGCYSMKIGSNAQHMAASATSAVRE